MAHIRATSGGGGGGQSGLTENYKFGLTSMGTSVQTKTLTMTMKGFAILYANIAYTNSGGSRIRKNGVDIYPMDTTKGVRLYVLPAESGDVFEFYTSSANTSYYGWTPY